MKTFELVPRGRTGRFAEKGVHLSFLTWPLSKSLLKVDIFKEYLDSIEAEIM